MQSPAASGPRQRPGSDDRDRGRAALELPGRTRGTRARSGRHRRAGDSRSTAIFDAALRANCPSQAYVGGVERYLFLDTKRDWVVDGRSPAATSPAVPRRSRGCRTHRSGTSTGRTRRTWSSIRGHVARRLDRQHEPESAERRARRQHRAVVGQSGLRFERCGLQVRERSRRRARGLPVSNPKVNRFARSRFVAAAKWYTWNFAREVQEDGSHSSGTSGSRTTGRSSPRSACSGGPGRSRDTRRAVDAAALFAQQFIGVESDGANVFQSGGNLGSNHDDIGAWNRGLGINVPLPSRGCRSRSQPDPTRAQPRPVAVRGRLEDRSPLTRADHATCSRPWTRRSQPADTRQLRVSPKMSLQLYMQPLVSVGHYTGFKQFARPRTFDFIPLDREPGSLTYDPVHRESTANRPMAAPRSSSTIPISTSSRFGST